MAVQKQDGWMTDAKPTATGHDLTNKERRLAARDASGNYRLAQLGEAVAGVIQQGRDEGYASSVMNGGLAKVIASAAWTAGQQMQAGADGTTIPGSTNPVGIARNAGFSGELCEIWLDIT